VASSYQVPLIILTYLGVVFILLQFMKNRPAYSLKLFIQIYNVAQILLNSFVLYGYLKAGMFTRTKLFLCPIGDFTVNAVTIGVISWAWSILSTVYHDVWHVPIRKSAKNPPINILIPFIVGTNCHCKQFEANFSFDFLIGYGECNVNKKEFLIKA